MGIKNKVVFPFYRSLSVIVEKLNILNSASHIDTSLNKSNSHNAVEHKKGIEKMSPKHLFFHLLLLLHSFHTFLLLHQLNTMRFSVVAIAALFLASHISAARTEPTQLQIGTRNSSSLEPL